MLQVFLAALESDDERELFTAIYEQNHSRMEHIAIQILNNQSDAEDAVQNAFMQVIRHFDKVHSIPCNNLVFWLISIVKNEAYMILRKQKRTVPIEDLEDWTAFSKRAEDVTDYVALVELFAELPDTYRQVLEMKIVLGYTDVEISEHLGITKTAVSTRVSRGRQLLREILDREGFQL